MKTRKPNSLEKNVSTLKVAVIIGVGTLNALFNFGCASDLKSSNIPEEQINNSEWIKAPYSKQVILSHFKNELAKTGWTYREYMRLIKEGNPQFKTGDKIIYLPDINGDGKVNYHKENLREW